MKKLDDLVKDGFQSNDPHPNRKDFALKSLEIGLKSYFSTYQAVKHRWDSLDLTDGLSQEDVDFYHPAAYCVFHAKAATDSR